MAFLNIRERRLDLLHKLHIFLQKLQILITAYYFILTMYDRNTRLKNKIENNST